MQAARGTSTEQLGQLAVAAESFFRSCNSLLERLHHSYLMYLQPSTATFITVDVYCVPPLLLIAAMMLWAAHLLVQPPQRSSAGTSVQPEAAAALEVDAHNQQERSNTGAVSAVLAKLKRRLRAKLGMRSACNVARQRFPESAEPLRLRTTVQQFGGCCCAVLLMNVVCAGTGAALWAVTASRVVSAVSADKAVTAVIAFAGLVVTLAGPAKGLQSSAGRGSQLATHPAESSTLASEQVGSLHNWQAYKACALLACAVMLAGCLFVNWCACYLSDHNLHLCMKLGDWGMCDC